MLNSHTAKVTVTLQDFPTLRRVLLGALARNHSLTHWTLSRRNRGPPPSEPAPTPAVDRGWFKPETHHPQCRFPRMENVKLTYQLSCCKDPFLVRSMPRRGKIPHREADATRTATTAKCKMEAVTARACRVPLVLAQLGYGTLGGSPRIPPQLEEATAPWKMVPSLLEATKASSHGVAPGTSGQRFADLPSAACSAFVGALESAGIF